MSVGEQLAEFESATRASAEARRGRKNAAAPIPATGVPAGLAGLGGGDAPPLAAGAESPPGPARKLVDEDGAREVARRLREAGVDDTLRPRVLAALSGGAWQSSKQVPVDELERVFAVVRQIRDGTLKLVDEDGGQVRIVDDDGVVTHTGGPPAQASPARPGRVGLAAWNEQLGRLRGVGPVKLLRRARQIAVAEGLTPPALLGDVDPASPLGKLVVAWIDEQADSQQQGA